MVVKPGCRAFSGHHVLDATLDVLFLHVRMETLIVQPSHLRATTRIMQEGNVVINAGCGGVPVDVFHFREPGGPWAVVGASGNAIDSLAKKTRSSPRCFSPLFGRRREFETVSSESTYCALGASTNDFVDSVATSRLQSLGRRGSKLC